MVKKAMWYLSEVMKENTLIRKELFELNDRLHKNNLIVENVVKRILKPVVN